MNKFYPAFVLLCIFCCFDILGQGNYHLKIVINDIENPDSILLKKSFEESKTFRDSIQVYKEIQSVLIGLDPMDILPPVLIVLLKTVSVFLQAFLPGKGIPGLF